MQSLLRHCRVLQLYCNSQFGNTIIRHGTVRSLQVIPTNAAHQRQRATVKAAASLEPSRQASPLQHTREPEPAGAFHVSVKDLAGKGKVRLDAYLAAQLPTASRAKISASIKAGLVAVNGVAVVKPSQALKGGDAIVVSLLPPEPCTATPEAIPLDIVYEDDHLIVVNKAPGMVVHLSPGHTTGTLVNALLAHCGLPPCTVASGSSSSSQLAGVGSSVGGGLLSAAAAGGAASASVGVIGGLLDDDWDLGEGEEDYSSSSSDGDILSNSSSTGPGSTAGAGSTGGSTAGTGSADGSTAGAGSAGGSTAGTGSAADTGSAGGSIASTGGTGGSTGIIRPGIVHRLDRGTSGLMVVAKTDYSHAHLCEQFKERSVSRIYNSITTGVPNPAAARIATNITRDPGNRLRMMAAPYGSGRGRAAASNYQMLQVLASGGAAVVQWKLETGRTHQIRVHARHLGHPLLGDDLYGPGHAAAARAVVGKRSSWLTTARAAIEGFARPALHAKTLGFTHPVTGQRLEFDSDWPDDFVQLHQQLQQLG